MEIDEKKTRKRKKKAKQKARLLLNNKTKNIFSLFLLSKNKTIDILIKKINSYSVVSVGMIKIEEHNIYLNIGKII